MTSTDNIKFYHLPVIILWHPTLRVTLVFCKSYSSLFFVLLLLLFLLTSHIPLCFSPISVFSTELVGLEGQIIRADVLIGNIINGWNPQTLQCDMSNLILKSHMPSYVCCRNFHQLFYEFLWIIKVTFVVVTNNPQSH